jgi:hypothetical protein
MSMMKQSDVLLFPAFSAIEYSSLLFIRKCSLYKIVKLWAI